MTPSEVEIDAGLMTRSVQVPEHVVYRQFPAETVVLNLNTGQYHGLNLTAGRMLEILQASESVGDAVDKLSEEYGQLREDLEADVRSLCADLLDRGLIELDGAA